MKQAGCVAEFSLFCVSVQEGGVWSPPPPAEKCYICGCRGVRRVRAKDSRTKMRALRAGGGPRAGVSWMRQVSQAHRAARG